MKKEILSVYASKNFNTEKITKEIKRALMDSDATFQLYYTPGEKKDWPKGAWPPISVKIIMEVAE
jgi:hypothetical protein